MKQLVYNFGGTATPTRHIALCMGKVTLLKWG